MYLFNTNKGGTKRDTGACRQVSNGEIGERKREEAADGLTENRKGEELAGRSRKQTNKKP